MKNAHKSELRCKVMSHILTGLPRQAGDSHSHVTALNGTSMPQRSGKLCRVRLCRQCLGSSEGGHATGFSYQRKKKDLMRSRLEKGGLMYSVRTRFRGTLFTTKIVFTSLHQDNEGEHMEKRTCVG